MRISCFFALNLLFVAAWVDPLRGDERKNEKKDLHGDSLPEPAVARMGTTRFRNGAGIFPIAYSPDGKLLATAGGTPWSYVGISSGDPSIRIWDVETRKEVRTLTDHAEGVSYLAFSPDRKTLAAVTSAASPILLWDITKNDAPRQIAIAEGGASHPVIAFSKEGGTIAICSTPPDSETERSIRLHDVATGKETGKLGKYRFPVTALAYSPDGRYLACKSGSSVYLWDTAKGNLVRTLQGRRYFAKQRLLNVEIEQQEPPMAPPMGFSPDSKLVAAVVDDAGQSVRIWSVAEGKEITSIGHQGRILSLQFAPDNQRIVTTSQDNSVRVWDATTGKESLRILGHFGGYVWAAFSPDGKHLATGSGDHAVRVWDSMTGKEIAPFDAHSAEVLGVVYSRDGKTIATVGRDCTVRTWNARTGQPVSRRDLEGTLVSSVSTSADGAVLAICDRDLAMAQVVESASGKVLGRFEIDTTMPSLSGDGKLVALVQSDGKPRVLDASTGKSVFVVDTIVDHSVQAVALSENGKFLAVDSAPEGIPSLRVWSVGEKKDPTTFELEAPDENAEQASPTTSMRFSPDGRVLALQKGPFSVELYDVLTGKLLRRVPTPVDRTFSNAIQSMAFSADGKALATVDGTSKRVVVWEVTTGKERRRFEGHRGPVSCVAISPDGRHVASGSWDTTVLVWDASSLAEDEKRVELKPTDLDELWKNLSNEDASVGYLAIRRLASSPVAAVAYIGEKLKPTATPEQGNVEERIKDLDSDDFATRERATERLREMGRKAEEPLRKALDGNLSVEAKKRIEKLLEDMKDAVKTTSPDRLREFRAVEVLELLETEDARRLLVKWAAIKGETPLLLDARAAVKRLELRR